VCSVDFEYAKLLNSTIKLLGFAQLSPDGSKVPPPPPQSTNCLPAQINDVKARLILSRSLTLSLPCACLPAS
jgi:hypothetical protein